MKEETAKKLLYLVKRNYQDIASEFNITRKKMIWPEINNIVAGIKAGVKILDVGCGNGRLIEVLKDRNINYFGLDNNKELIEIARNNYPGYKFSVGELLNLEEMPEYNFDYIFCLAVLPHIPSQKLRIKALEELRKKLSPSGQIILSVWNLWSRAAKKGKFRRLIFKNSLLKISGRSKLDLGDLVFPWKNSLGEAVSDRYYHAFTMMELRDLAKKTGLHVHWVKKDSFNYWLILN